MSNIRSFFFSKILKTITSQFVCIFHEITNDGFKKINSDNSDPPALKVTDDSAHGPKLGYHGSKYHRDFEYRFCSFRSEYGST